MSSRNYLPLFHKGSIMFGTIGSRPSHVDGESFFFLSGFMFRPSHFFFCVSSALFGTLLWNKYLWFTNDACKTQ